MTPEQLLLWRSIIRFGVNTGIELAEFFQNNRDRAFDELLAEARKLSAKKYSDYDPSLEADLAASGEGE